LPLNFLRGGLYIGGVTLMGLGAVVIWGGVVFSDLTPVEVYDYEWIGYIIIAFGAASIFTGLMAFLAAYFKNLCLLGVFLVLCFIVGTVLLVFGAGMLYGRTKVDDILQDEEDCRDSEMFEDADKAIITSAALICTNVCPCDMDEELKDRYFVEYNRVILDGNAEAITNCEPCSTLDALPEEVLESEECQTLTSENFIDTYFSEDEQDAFEIAEWVEDEFDCAGICTPVNFYVFSDVNRGIPTDSCMEEVRDWAKEVLEIYGSLSVALGAWLWVNCVMTYCLCCHPDRRKEKSNDGANTASPEQEQLAGPDKL